jgi:Ca-activated chloride channel family protein
MTQFTSFVAVEEMTITDGGVPRRVEVPVELPDGVSREGVFGEDDEKQPAASPMMARSVVLSGSAGGSGVGYGSSGGVGPVLRTEAKARSRKPATVKDSRRTDKVSNRSSSVVVADEVAASPGRKLTLKEQKAAELQAKLHPTIAALIERIKTKRTPAADEAKFVRDNKAEIQIWLTDKSPQVLEELKKLGFEVVLDPQSAKMVIGRIALDKLAALAEVKAVRYISPQAKN